MYVYPPLMCMYVYIYCLCPCTPSDAAVNGTRQCGEDGLWGEFITSQCVSDTVLELRDAVSI